MSLHQYHIAQLAALCEANPVERKIVFVPSRQVGYNLGNALAREGHAWVNLYLTTPADWAERLVGSRLRAQGWRPLVQGADLFAVHALIRHVKWPTGHPFAAAVSATGVAAAFMKTIQALRGAGFDGDDLSPTKLSRASMLTSVFRDYCKWLEDRKLYDQTRLFKTATADAQAESSAVVVLFDEVTLTRAGYEFVSELSAGEIFRIGKPSYRAPMPQQCAGRRFESAPLLPAADKRTQISANGAGRSVELREAVGVENEIRGVLRELLSLGVRLDSVEIAYATEEPYLSLLIDAADRFDLPLSSAAGIPVTCTSSGQALFSFYRWIAGGYDPADLIRLCRSRLIATKSTYAIAPELIGQLLEESRAGRGRNSYRRGLRRLEDHMTSSRCAESAGLRSSEDDQSANEINVAHGDNAKTMPRRAREALDGLSELCPAGERATLQDLCRAGVQFLDAFAPTDRSERDQKAAESLRDRLSDLGVNGDEEGTVGELSQLLVELLARHKIEASVAKPGHLYVVPLKRAGYSGRSRLVVVGMAETTFPGVALEDPILLDDERRIVSDDLLLERPKSSEATWHFDRAIAMAADKIMLVATRRSIADGRETYPAAVFQEYATRENASPVRVFYPTSSTGDALDESELVLAARSGDVRALLERSRPWLLHGRSASRERAGRSLGRFHGWLGRSTSELRPSEHVNLSASRLEDLATCPYRYFLKNILQVRPPDRPEERPDRWLSHLEFGSLLHDVLREFMEVLADRDERVDSERHAPLLAEVLTRNVERVEAEIPVIHEAAYRADLARLRRAVGVFLAEESRRDADPVGFEVSFGLHRSDGLSRPEPIKLRLSETITLRLRGSIDRVDRTSDGYEVWDYKSGSSTGYDEMDLFTEGRKLQWALYAYALEDLLEERGENGRVLRSGYFFTNDREHGLRLAEAPPSRELLAQRIEPLLDMVAEGGFLHVQKNDACKFCDYHSVCSTERICDSDLEEINDATPAERTFLLPLQRWLDGD